jgi:hypothetical protein
MVSPHHAAWKNQNIRKRNNLDFSSVMIFLGVSNFLRLETESYYKVMSCFYCHLPSIFVRKATTDAHQESVVWRKRT